MRDYEKARASYEQVIEEDPDHPGVYYNLGNIYFREGNFDEALDMYKQERVHGRSSPSLLSRVWMNTARIYTRKGLIDSARYSYKQAIELDSSNATALMWMGQLYEDEGEYQQALHYSTRGLDKEPDNVNYQFIVGTQYYRLGNLDSAAHYLEKVVERRPWYAAAVNNLGQVLLRQGNEQPGKTLIARADTLRQWESKIDELEANAQIYNNTTDWIKLGYALQNSGRLKEAREAFSVALTLDPTNLSYHNLVANLCVYLGDTTEAINRYKSILSADSTMSSTWVNLGIVYYNNGRTADARNAFRNALQHDPEQQAAKTYLKKIMEG